MTEQIGRSRARLTGGSGSIATIPPEDLGHEARTPTGREVLVGGLVLVRQRPATAGGILFVTLEDETGSANLIVKPEVFERCRRAAVSAAFLLARGRVERKGLVVHVQTRELATGGDPFEASLVRSRDFR